MTFDIDKQLMRCGNCERLEENPEMFYEEIRFDQYHCSNCGAMLAVNEDEITTDCPYCGEQSVIFDGKDDWFCPEYIVPFRMTKRNAIGIMKQEFAKYRFAPKKIREFDVESVRPVYIPFQIHSLHVDTEQKIQGTVRKIGNKNAETILHYRSIEVDYDNLEVDVSKNMPDRVSIRLGPWNMKDEKKFHPMYIAGLFAAVDDVGTEDAYVEAEKRACQMIDEKVMKSCSESSNNRLIEAKHDCHLNHRHLTLMPVWFFSSSYKGKKYAAVVNGQTGKIVSAVPVFRHVFWGIVVLVTLLCGVPVYWLLNLVYTIFAMGMKEIGFYLGAAVVLGLWFLLRKSYHCYIEYKENLLVFQDRDIVGIAERSSKK